MQKNEDATLTFTNTAFIYYVQLNFLVNYLRFNMLIKIFMYLFVLTKHLFQVSSLTLFVRLNNGKLTKLICIIIFIKRMQF